MADAKDSMDSNIAAADESLASANDTASGVAQVTGQASEVANAAAVAVADTNTDQESAEAIIADATATVEEAEKQFASAEETYNNKLSEYESAKAEYEAAAEEYNNKKSQATSDLSDAEATLTDAQEKLASLEEQLEAAGQDLAAAGADALIAADADKSDVTSYIATVVEHYYAPNTELADGQSVSNFTVTPYKGNVIGISYDIVDADGNVVRTVSANYGYTVDYKSGEVRIYDRDMVYEYQDINGNTVSLTKEEAEQLKDGVIEYSYWTATGFYIPSYSGVVYESTYVKQKGYVWRYSYENLVKLVAKDGMVVTSTKQQYYQEGYFNYYQGTGVSSNVANSKYTSEDDLKNAIVDDAKKQNKATGVAFDKSKLLNITEHKTTAEVYSYEVNNNQVFTSASKDYASYISEITEKYNAYKAFSEAVSSAKADFESAKQTVSSLKQQIADLDAASDINTAMELARLQGELEKAQAEYDIAKSNLADAKNALENAQSTYDARFNTVSSIEIAQADSEEVIQYAEEIEEEELEEEEIEEEEEESEEEIHIITSPSSNAGGYGGEAEIPQDQPEEPAPEETVTIEEEQAPTGITLAGLMERGKWFVGLAGVSTAGVGVGILEAKRRAAIKLIDKLNQ